MEMQIGERICQLRKEQGWTQTDLARIVKVAAPTVSCWEAGKKRPELPKVAYMSDLFGVTVDYLLGRTDVRGGV